MKRFLGRLLGMTLLIAGASLSPAFAANELGLSRDGVNWSNSITNPIFDESMRWVPGDSEAATFYVRNQGGTLGDLTVDVLGSRVGDLIDSGDLHVTAKGGNGAWTKVSEGGTHRLLTSLNIPDGAVVPIKVTVAFDFSSPNATQNRASDLNFRVALAQAAAIAPTDDEKGNKKDDETGSSGLPGTGAPAIGWFVAISAVLMGVGLALVRRRHEEESADV